MTSRLLGRARLAVLVGVVVALFPTVIWGHPLGNFTVNRYSRIVFNHDQVAVLYVVDMAEIPALQERQRIDANNDGIVSQAEQDAAAAVLAQVLAEQLTLVVDNQPIALAPTRWSMSFPPGQGGLSTLRFELELAAGLVVSEQPQEIRYQDTNYIDRLGWSEIVMRGQNVELHNPSVAANDISDALRHYPEDMLQAPPSITKAEAQVSAKTGFQSAWQGPDQTGVVQPNNRADSFAALVSTPFTEPLGLLLALVAAFGLGCAHALAPGHGKTIVAAYLVGARGTPLHAVFLGLTTTITHTAGVFAFGLITLFVSRFILPEQLYPLLGVASGVMVLLIGWGLLRARLAAARETKHDVEGLHSHGFGLYHSHATKPHPNITGAQSSPLRRLLLLGISGGLIPCPSALVVLLGAVALGRTSFGLLLVFVFSLGLACVLTSIGLVLVYARQLFERLPARGLALRFLPVASAFVVMIAGGVITIQALMSIA